MAANVEAIRILSLDVVTKAASAKARLLINIDIVKPMPANKPIPAKCFHVIFSVMDAKPDFTNVLSCS